MARPSCAQSSTANDVRADNQPNSRSPLEALNVELPDRVSRSMVDAIDPYEPASTLIVLRASQLPLPSQGRSSTHNPSALAFPTRLPNKERALVITAALFGLGVLLLATGVACLIRRKRRGPRGDRSQENGLYIPRDFDGSSWGTTIGDKRNLFQDYSTEEAPRLPAPSADPNPTTSCTDLSAMLEQFEKRLQQEEKDIACALDIAFGDEADCAPFFQGSDDEVTTMLALQAGMECVGKRACATKNRARQGSDASASSQETAVTAEGFSSHNSSTSSLTSMDSMTSDIDESVEEAEEEAMVYEVKRAQTQSMEIQKGRLVVWQPDGLRVMVTGPSSTTLETASSTISVNLDLFPSPP